MTKSALPANPPLAGQVAVITGAGRGIGRAIVLELASSGIKVAFTYHSNHQAANSLCQEVQEHGGVTAGFQYSTGQVLTVDGGLYI